MSNLKQDIKLLSEAYDTITDYEDIGIKLGEMA